MKLGKLTIRNIASIEHAEIDFSDPDWCNEPLFLIHGETGSGKSSILDCICLALFKQTPRMKNGSKTRFIDNVFGGKDMASNSVLQYVRKDVDCNAEIYSELEFFDDEDNQYIARLEFRLTRNYTFSGKGYNWTLQKNAQYVDEKVVETEITKAIGLDFDQFCRTTMLAQGEFTKFLKADEKDKASILSKITSTEIYYTIGLRINERQKAEAAKLQSQKEQLSGMSVNQLSTDAICQLEAAIAVLEADNANRAVLIRIYQEQSDWLETDEVNRKALNAASGAYAAAKKAMEDPQVAADQQLIADWNATIDARQQRATVLENEPKLERIRTALTTLREGLPELKKVEAEKKQKADEADKLQKQLYAAFAKLDAKSLTDEKDLLAQRMKVLDCYSKQKTAVQNKQQAEGAVKQYKPEVEAAEKALNAAKNAYDSNARTVADFTKMLRAELKVGEKCPVCGQIVTELVHDDEFEALLKPFKEAMDAADKALKAANSRLAELQTDAKTKGNLLTTAEKEYNNELAKLQATESRTGLVSKDFADVDAAARIAEIESELAKISTAKKAYETAKNAYDAAQKAFTAAETARETAEANISTNEASKKTLAPIVRDAKQAFESFISEGHFAAQRIAELAQYTAAAIARKSESVQQKLTELNRAEGAYNTAVHTVEEHAERKPVIASCDTKQSIDQRISGLQNATSAASAAIVANRTKVQTARQNATAISQLLADIDKQQTVVSEWTDLQKEFSPTADGFSRIAQNFILGDLLNKANAHLSHFCPRYELASQSGSFAILVKDRLAGGAGRPADMLSGGESFLVSLSLALALAKLGNLSSSVDVLFIDEGFDTLDENTLNQVIDTMSMLHNDTSRRIGLISHVGLLLDNIPWHIAVRRKAGQEGVSCITVGPAD